MTERAVFEKCTEVFDNACDDMTSLIIAFELLLRFCFIGIFLKGFKLMLKNNNQFFSKLATLYTEFFETISVSCFSMCLSFDLYIKSSKIWEVSSMVKD